MPNFSVEVFAANNFSNPQNPGFLPAEDASYISDLMIGDQMTWLGGGESAVIKFTDNVDSNFNEANQIKRCNQA